MILIYKHPIFRDNCLVLLNILKENFNVTLVLYHDHLKYDNTQLYIGFFNGISRLPKNFVFINTEPLRSNPWDDMRLFNDARYIFEYSTDNIQFIQEEYPHLQAKMYFVPFGYDKSMETIYNIQDTTQLVDVCFIGTINDRRRTKLLEIGAKYTLAAPNLHGEKLYNDERMRLLKNARVVVDIKYYDNVDNDLHRIGPFIANDIFFITEEYKDKEIYTKLREFGIVTEYDDIINLLTYWLEKPAEERIKKIREIKEWFVCNYSIKNYIPYDILL